MQRIEKYGVIALVFLLVTILAVSLWSQKKGKSPFAFLKRDSSSDTSVAQAPNDAGSGSGAAPISPDASVQNPNGPSTTPPLNPNGTAQGANPPVGVPAPAGPNAAGPSTAGPNTGGPNTGGGNTGGPNTPGSANPLVAGGGSSIGNPNAAQNTPTDGAPWNQPPVRKTLNGPKPSGPKSEESHGVATHSYTVKKGDTLGTIAAHELGSFGKWEEIAKLNHGLDPKKLRAGMKIDLPADAKVAKASAKAIEAPTKLVGETHAANGSYTVKKGDTLSSIAAAELGQSARWLEIKKLNPSIQADRLIVGTRLRLPEHVAKAERSNETLAAATPPKNRVR